MKNKKGELVIIKNKDKSSGMSYDMYRFIIENIGKLKKIDCIDGIIFTTKGTNGTVCSSTGYLRARIKDKVLQVHQIMAVIYFGKQCIGKQINHKDGNKLNNKKYNLETVTRSENVKHEWMIGLCSNNRFRKLSDEDVRYIRKNHTPNIKYSEHTTTQLARKYGVSVSTIRGIVNNERYAYIK